MLRRIALIIGALGALAGAAACGAEERVVLELVGDVPGAARVDVLLLEPLVRVRTQRATMPESSGTSERVYYVAQRASVSIPLEGLGTDRLRVELQDEGGPYIPLVGVRDAAGDLLAFGLYNAPGVLDSQLGSRFSPSAVAPRADVTIYEVPLEDVTLVPASDEPGPLKVAWRHAVAFACADGQPPSGLVWRPFSGVQLRVLLPLDGGDGSAVARLDRPDLDCDGRQAGMRDPGSGPSDALDCDDTSAQVHEGAREQCTAIDDDCDPTTRYSLGECPMMCGGPADACVCDEGESSSGQPPIRLCTEPEQRCVLTAMVKPTQELRVCDHAGTFALGPLCAPSCKVTLVSAPEDWDVRLDGRGVNQTVDTTTGAVEIRLRTGKVYAGGLEPGRVFIHAEREGAVQTFALDLKLEPLLPAGTACPSEPVPLTCLP